MPNFLDGAERKGDKDHWQHKFATAEQVAEIEREAKRAKNVAFDAMIGAFHKCDFLRIVRAINPGVENLARFERRYAWADIMSDVTESADQDVTHLLDALITLVVSDESKFHDLLSTLPNSFGCHFRLGRVYIYAGEQDDGLADNNDSNMFDLKFSIDPQNMADQVAARKAFDRYFDAIRHAILNFAEAQASPAQ
jgi:hypothetical protein